MKLKPRKKIEEKKQEEIELRLRELDEEVAEVRRSRIETMPEEDEEDEEKKRAAGLILKRRALIRAIKRLSRAKKITLLLSAVALILLLTFISAVVQERMGNFTININRMEVYRQGLMLADNKDFKNPKSRLKAAAVQNATNISVDDLPDDLHLTDGEHNGKDYMAYTFYIRNGGREIVDYYANIAIEMEVKGVSDAVRVAVYDENGERTIYAKIARNGEPEPGTVPFVSSDLVMEHYVQNFEVNDVDKYTVVVWLEGDDPQCIDDIIGGMIRMSMNIDVADPIGDDDDWLHRLTKK